MIIRGRLFLLCVILATCGFISLLHSPSIARAEAPSAPLRAIVAAPTTIDSAVTWTSDNVYWVSADLTITSTGHLTIEGGTWVKFSPDVLMKVEGNITLGSTLGNEVVFTSVFDNGDGVDVSGTGGTISPMPGDWGSIQLTNSAIVFDMAQVKYSTDGVSVYNTTLDDLSPTISNCLFAYNENALTLISTNNGTIHSLIDSNEFTNNDYGIQVRRSANKTATAYPTIQNNKFERQQKLPIYLSASAYPEYSGNTFLGSDGADKKLGIGVGGAFTASGTLYRVNDLPYVVLSNWTIETGQTVTLQAGTVVKFDYYHPSSGLYRQLIVNGTLTLEGTAGEPIYFTSIRDDTVGGDVNGDGVATEALAGDWEHILFKDNAVNFHHAVVRYARKGINYDNTKNVLQSPVISDSTFAFNETAIYVRSADNVASRTVPQLSNNKISNSTSWPIYLVRTVFPNYEGNIFENNDHPVIALNGNVWSSGTWYNVPGENSTTLPYLVYGTVTVKNTAEPNKLTIEADTIFKFHNAPDNPADLTIEGDLVLQGYEDHPITFTTYYDDNFAGDTNNDGLTRAPKRGDYQGIILRNNNSPIHHIQVFYATQGLTVENTSLIDYEPAISNSLFRQNTYGLNLAIKNSGKILSDVGFNTFDQNTYGLGTTCTSGKTGISIPRLHDNTFTANDGFPILFNGAASPVYENNYFANHPHRAIGINGYFGANATLTQVPGDVNAPFNGKFFPYVVPDLNKAADVDENLRLADGATLTIPAGSWIKLDNDTFFDISGTLDLLGTSTSPITFTSYRDDSYDDTNGDATTTTPAESNWRTIYIRSANDSTILRYLNVKYSKEGLQIVHSQSFDVAPLIEENDFLYNRSGLTLNISSTYSDIRSTIRNNTFESNKYGLVVVNSRNTVGAARVTLDNNGFFNHTGFPLYLFGSADIKYSISGGEEQSNAFAGNIHPAIAVNGYWAINTTWSRVTGDNGNIFPYVVYWDNGVVNFTGFNGFLRVAETGNIQLPVDTVVKVDANLGMYVYGLMTPLSGQGSKVYITSYKDDTLAGDTNADGNATSPGKNDWKSIWLYDNPIKRNHIHDVEARYGMDPFTVFYEGPAGTLIDTKFERLLLTKNRAGIMLVIGPEGIGSIKADILDVHMLDNDYGLLTLADHRSTGIIMPDLTRVVFENTAIYPLFLGGTSSPNFIETEILGGPALLSETEGSAVASIEPISMEVELPEFPAEAYQMPEDLDVPELLSSAFEPQANITLANSFAPAIGLAGAWNNNVVLAIPAPATVPYAVEGNFPIYVTYIGQPNLRTEATDDVQIGRTNPTGSKLSFSKPGTIIKFGKGLGMNVLGALDVMGTQANPAYFTSIKDDSVGGDTNRDGSLTTPAKGDWKSVTLSSSDTTLQYATMRYATDGVNVFFKGAINQNINPTIKDMKFFDNKTAITLWAAGDGDIGKRPAPPVDPGEYMQIYKNLFLDNDNHIVIKKNVSNTGSPPPSVKGLVYVEIKECDFMESTDYGVNNLMVPRTDTPAGYYDARAINNYWGHPSGPFHPTKNSDGQGVNVSNLVIFEPFSTSNHHAVELSTIFGRVTYKNPSNPAAPGIPGVQVRLSGGAEMVVTTDANGNYRFDGLVPGFYQVVPMLAGYDFTPPLFGPAEVKASSQLQINFEGSLQISGKYVMLPIEMTAAQLNRDVTLQIPVELTQPVIGPVVITFGAVAGTAGTGDYAVSTTNITIPQGSLSGVAKVTIKKAVAGENVEFFTFKIVNVTGDASPYPGRDTTKIWIVPPENVYLPAVRK